MTLINAGGSMKITEIIRRLNDLDEWAGNDSWWNELFFTYRKEIQPVCLSIANRMKVLAASSDVISPQQFASFFRGAFQPEVGIHPHMQGELIALIFKNDEDFQKNVNACLK